VPWDELELLGIDELGAVAELGAVVALGVVGELGELDLTELGVVDVGDD